MKVLERVRSMLAPGGRLLLTTACRGGAVGMEVLDLWFGCADFGGPLPHAAELAAQLESAGFTGSGSGASSPASSSAPSSAPTGPDHGTAEELT